MLQSAGLLLMVMWLVRHRSGVAAMQQHQSHARHRRDVRLQRRAKLARQPEEELVHFAVQQNANWSARRGGASVKLM